MASGEQYPTSTFQIPEGAVLVVINNYPSSPELAEKETVDWDQTTEETPDQRVAEQSSQNELNAREPVEIGMSLTPKAALFTIGAFALASITIVYALNQ